MLLPPNDLLRSLMADKQPGTIKTILGQLVTVMNAGPHTPLLIAIRVLNASSVKRVPPNVEDVTFLGEITGDAYTPIEELARDIVQRVVGHQKT